MCVSETDTSCILAWLIEQGYEVYAFMADVGQEEVRFVSYGTTLKGIRSLTWPTGLCCC